MVIQEGSYKLPVAERTVVFSPHVPITAYAPGQEALCGCNCHVALCTTGKDSCCGGGCCTAGMDLWCCGRAGPPPAAPGTARPVIRYAPVPAQARVAYSEAVEAHDMQ
jgi:hypothetical protein